MEEIRSTAARDESCPENIGRGERLLSTLAGAWMLAWGVLRARRSPWSLLVALAGGPLLQRGRTGRSLLYQALRLDTLHRSTCRPGVDPERAEVVQVSVDVGRPIYEVYEFLRDLEHVPQFSAEIESVTRGEQGGWRWVMEGPLGGCHAWEAEVTQAIEPERIVWRSRPGSEPANEVSIDLHALPAGGTEVSVRLSFEPIGGKLGVLAARMVGRDPLRVLHRDLERLKLILESRPAVRPRGDEARSWGDEREEQVRNVEGPELETDPGLAEARQQIAEERAATISDRADFESDQSFPASDPPARY